MEFDTEPGEAIQALERVAGRPPEVDLLNGASPRTPGPEVHGAGSFRACCTKLEAAIGSQRTAMARARWREQNTAGYVGTAWAGLLVGLPAWWVATLEPPQHLLWVVPPFSAYMLVVVAAEQMALRRVLTAQDVAHGGRLDALRRVLERLGQAADPGARFVLRVDLATADQAPPRSQEAVPVRFRTKLGALFPQTERSYEPLTRHRHRWAEVSFVMPCASPVRLVLADEVVYRGRHQREEVRRTSGLSGHITPIP